MTPLPVRILFVESYPQTLVGQQQTLLGMLARCPAHGIAPVVATPGPGPFVDELRARGLEHVELAYPAALAPYGGAIYRYGAGRKLAALGATARYVLAIRSRLRALAPAGVYCNDMRAILTVGAAARLCRLPVMTWDKLDKPHGRLDALQLPLVQVNAIISEAVTAKYPRWQARRHAGKIVRINNAIDLAPFDRAAPARDRLGLAPDDLVFAIVGSITQRKGHDRLLRVWPRLVERVPQARLLVVGAPASPADEAFMDRLRSAEAPNVVWLGSRSDVPAIMHSIDVLVVPSRTEGMGRVNLEAMAAGRPVIGARAGGIPEVVIDGTTGLLFEGDDPEDLLRCLVRLAGSSREREAMGRAGRARVERHFDQAIQLDRVLGLLRGMVDGAPQRARSESPRPAGT